MTPDPRTFLRPLAIACLAAAALLTPATLPLVWAQNAAKEAELPDVPAAVRFKRPAGLSIKPQFAVPPSLGKIQAPRIPVAAVESMVGKKNPGGGQGSGPSLKPGIPGGPVSAPQPVAPPFARPKPEIPTPPMGASQSNLTAPPAPANPFPTSPKKRGRSGRLVVLTNFEKATVTVNGEPYPAYVEPGAKPGMDLPIGGPYQVTVTYDGKARNYQVRIEHKQTRMLMVDLSGYQGSAMAPQAATPKPSFAPAPSPPPGEPPAQAENAEKGRVTVYSKPRGTIFVGDKLTTEQTPGTVEVEPGRHDVQVRYEDGSMSEKKVIRVRAGSRIKLFFRKSGEQ